MLPAPMVMLPMVWLLWPARLSPLLLAVAAVVTALLVLLVLALVGVVRRPGRLGPDVSDGVGERDR
jgi:hypothetical protein